MMMVMKGVVVGIGVVVSSVVMANKDAHAALFLVPNLLHHQFTAFLMRWWWWWRWRNSIATIAIPILIHSTILLILLSTFLPHKFHKFLTTTSSSSFSSSSYPNPNHTHSYAPQDHDSDDEEIIFTQEAEATPPHHHFEGLLEKLIMMMPPIHHQQQFPAPPITPPAATTTSPPSPPPAASAQQVCNNNNNSALVIITTSTSSQEEEAAATAPQLLHHPPPPPPYESNTHEWALATYSTYTTSTSTVSPSSHDFHHRPSNYNFPTHHQQDSEALSGTIDSTWKAIQQLGLVGGGGPAAHAHAHDHHPPSPSWKHKQMNESKTSWDRQTTTQSSSKVPPHQYVQVRRLDSEEVIPSSPRYRELRKALTFNDAVSGCIRGGLIRGTPPNQLEFNKQIEDFIKTRSSSNNNNNDNMEMMRLRIMRLQRQESNKRFSEMIQGRLTTSSSSSIS